MRRVHRIYRRSVRDMELALQLFAEKRSKSDDDPNEGPTIVRWRLHSMVMLWSAPAVDRAKFSATSMMASWRVVHRRAPRTPRSVAIAVLFIVLSGCGNSSAEKTGPWCDLLGETVEISTSIDGLVAGSDEESQLARELGAVMKEVDELGWPAELSAERELLQGGPQIPGTPEAREYDQALEESKDFVRRECDLSADEAEMFFGS